MRSWQDMPADRRRDAVVGLTTALIFGWLLTYGVQIGISYAPGTALTAVSPAFFPYLLSVAGLFFSLCVIAGALTSSNSIAGDHSTTDVIPFYVFINRTLLLFLILFIYYYLFRIVGALLLSVFIFALLLFLGGERQPIRLIVLSLVLPTGVYLLFAQLANVPLPRGISPL